MEIQDVKFITGLECLIPEPEINDTYIVRYGDRIVKNSENEHSLLLAGIIIVGFVIANFLEITSFSIRN